jgi:hypothetical protein
MEVVMSKPTSSANFALKGYVETDTEFPGSFEIILSDPSQDRDGEIVDSKCFSVTKALPARISMDTDHKMTVESTVGSGVPSYNPNGDLVVAGEWARTDHAQMTRSLVADGHIPFTSVAFRTLRSKVDAKGVRHIVDAELLNGTFTQIPSNANARVLSAKVGARNSKADAANIQQAHDLLAIIGATCDNGGLGKHFRVNSKAIVGSVEALQERVNDALEDAYVDEESYGCCYSRGVIPSAGGGTVIFSGFGCDALESDESYRQTFSDDGAVVTLTGTAEIVDIAEIVTPDADAAREDQATAKATEPTAKAAGSLADAAARLALNARALTLSANATVI